MYSSEQVSEPRKILAHHVNEKICLLGLGQVVYLIEESYRIWWAFASKRRILGKQIW